MNDEFGKWCLFMVFLRITLTIKSKPQSDYTLRSLNFRTQFPILLAGLRVALTFAGLFDVVFHQLRRVGLGAAHDEITGCPEIAGGIFFLHAREFGEDLFRSLGAHDAHQVAG